MKWYLEDSAYPNAFAFKDLFKRYMEERFLQANVFDFIPDSRGNVKLHKREVGVIIL